MKVLITNEQKKFINSISIKAQKEMQKVNVLASLTIAQCILESGWGTSKLSREANNLFGVKGQGNNGCVKLSTEEFYEGKRYEVEAEFRKYVTIDDSIADHTHLFTFPRYKNLRGCTDYKQACRFIQMDGYATDPKYAQKLIDVIEKYNLYIYDLQLNIMKNIFYGEVSIRIGVLQNLLNKYAYKIPVDNNFGPLTKGAVRDFQRSHSLTVDGIVGQYTASKL
jgi:N-acetylmuramoyl-L-alanine amidase